jgi:hypothetical protein
MKENTTEITGDTGISQGQVFLYLCDYVIRVAANRIQDGKSHQRKKIFEFVSLCVLCDLCGGRSFPEQYS